MKSRSLLIPFLEQIVFEGLCLPVNHDVIYLLKGRLFQRQKCFTRRSQIPPQLLLLSSYNHLSPPRYQQASN